MTTPSTSHGRPSRSSGRRHRTRLADRLPRVRPLNVLGLVLIAAACLGAIYAQNLNARPVHVFPHEGRTEYQMNVHADGHSLTADEVSRRYRIAIRGITILTPEGLRQVIREQEGARTAGTETYVRLHTRLNGGNEEIWLWPEN